VTFTEWLEKNHKLVVAGAKVEREKGVIGDFTNLRDGMELAWDAACEACARAQNPMLRSMFSRTEAASHCRALKVEVAAPRRGHRT
jgi:hypothetical protein